MSEVIKIDDPVIKVFVLSTSQYQDFYIECKDNPYSNCARAAISTKKTDGTVLECFELGNGLERIGTQLKFRIDGTKYKRHTGRKLFFEFTGYADGDRNLIKELIFKNSAL